MPEDVKDVSALLDAQYGDIPYGARPFGEGLPSQITKLVEDHDGDTYRAAYTVAFEEAVYVLNVFQKKAKSGVGTPKHVKDRVLARFKAAEQYHEPFRKYVCSTPLPLISMGPRGSQLYWGEISR
jgi:phage-related protein